MMCLHGWYLIILFRWAESRVLIVILRHGIDHFAEICVLFRHDETSINEADSWLR